MVAVAKKPAKKKPADTRRGPQPRKPSPGNPWPELLRALRKSLNITQEQAADRCGVKTRTWVAWENSQSQPSRLALNLLKFAFPKADFPE